MHILRNQLPLIALLYIHVQQSLGLSRMPTNLINMGHLLHSLDCFVDLTSEFSNTENKQGRTDNLSKFTYKRTNHTLTE